MKKIKLREGDQAPDFEIQDQEGDLRTLEEFNGKLLLLYFYPKDNTPGCTNEACGFRDSYDDLIRYVHVVGVSGDSVDSHQKFAGRHGLQFPLLADTKKEMIHAYGADGVFFSRRVSFLINREGTIVKIYEKVNPLEHPDEVMEEVAALQ